MSKCTENSPVGFTDCTFCGAKVEIRKSHKTGKAYWTCDGDHDVRACHSQVRLGPRPTRDLLDKRTRVAAASKPRPASPPPAESKPDAKPCPAAPATASPKPAPGTPPPSSAGGQQQAEKPQKADKNPFAVWDNLFGR